MSESPPRPEPLDLERLPKPTPEDIAALRRARAERVLATEDYLRALRHLPPAPRTRRPPPAEPFRLP
jgi:hypothetical protein